ncbi:MAG: cytochrome c-type biogenesis protein CcmH [Gemmatimonadota bacterium]
MTLGARRQAGAGGPVRLVWLVVALAAVAGGVGVAETPAGGVTEEERPGAGGRMVPGAATQEAGVAEEARSAEPAGGPGEREASPERQPGSGGAGAALEPAELDALTARVAAQLRCPVCRNQSVLESSAELAREMQSVIRERLAAGETPEQVRAYFVSRYGEWILLKPEARGLNLLVYLLPAVATFGGAIFLYRRLRRWAARPAGPKRGESIAPPGSGAPVAGGGTTTYDRLTPEDRRWLEEAVRGRGPGNKWKRSQV